MLERHMLQIIPETELVLKSLECTEKKKKKGIMPFSLQFQSLLKSWLKESVVPLENQLDSNNYNYFEVA